MTIHSTLRLTALIIATQAGLACSRFVWHEDPFTPDPAPASETIVAGRDTTYVLKTPSYYLLASQRAALWNREVMDDVAWRYHAAVRRGAATASPSRLDSASVALGTRDSATTWRGVPFAPVCAATSRPR